MRKSIYDDKVVKMLGKSGGMKASTVAAQLGTRASTIYKVLTRLVEQGRIHKDGQLFAIVDEVSIKSPEDVSDLIARPVSADVKTLVEEEFNSVVQEISDLERELHVLREIHNRLYFILGHAR
jgi:predicted transcriptional regulator